MPPAQDDPPVWLLDVDGVVNALALFPPDSWPERSWVERLIRADVPGQGRLALRILAARPVLEFVASVHDRGAAEVVWHSTWREAAITDLAPALGLPPIPISVAPEWEEPQEGWWKLPAAERVVATGRRLVWTDDHIDLFRDDPSDGPALAALGAQPGVLLLCPDPERGLSPADLGRIAVFLRGA